MGWLEELQMRLLPDGEPNREGIVKTLARWLLIFDNADKIDHFNDHMPKGGWRSLFLINCDPLTISQLASENRLRLRRCKNGYVLPEESKILN